ncbi:hypothetical protein VKT23_019598 [Stygiomarasmius scandens]|uniref:Uncharacterized protein n=1 Tax=Marasmiellus scandens TaxID=2682957 RepID=A0ABR1IL45_9AGAR
MEEEGISGSLEEGSEGLSFEVFEVGVIGFIGIAEFALTGGLFQLPKEKDENLDGGVEEVDAAW